MHASNRLKDFIFTALISVLVAPSALSEPLFVSPQGKAGAEGSIESPTTLSDAVNRVTAGQIIYLRGGLYHPQKMINIQRGNDGEPQKHKRIWAYQNEQPILNFSAATGDKPSHLVGIKLSGDHWHIKGIVVEKTRDKGIYVSGHHNIVEGVVTRFNGETGIQIGTLSGKKDKVEQWPSHNLIISCESHDNKDEGGEDADGFAAKLTSGPGNVFRYTVAHHNSDDGWDLYTKSKTGPIFPVLIEHSIAYNNGTLSNGQKTPDGDGNGFKLGGEDIGVNHVLRENLAYNNDKHGFTYNRNIGQMSIDDNLAIANAKRNFSFSAGESVFTQNLSCHKGSDANNDKIVGDDDGSNQWWQGANSKQCAKYLNKTLAWQFEEDGQLVYWFE